MRVVRNIYRFQYTNFILTNDSGLDKEEKNKKPFFTFIFISLFGKLDKEELLNE